MPEGQMMLYYDDIMYDIVLKGFTVSDDCHGYYTREIYDKSYIVLNLYNNPLS